VEINLNESIFNTFYIYFSCDVFGCDVLCLSHGFVDPMITIVGLIGKWRLKTVAVVVEELSREVLVIGLCIVDRLV